MTSRYQNSSSLRAAIRMRQQMRLSEYLKQEKMSKRVFADFMGVNKSTVSRWGDNPPLWVLRYLELYVEFEGVKGKIRNLYETTK